MATSGRRKARAPRGASSPGPKIVLIVVPLVLLAVAVVVWRQSDNETVKASVDPNSEIQRLEAQVGDLRKRLRTVATELKSEHPDAKAHAERLRSDVEQWRKEWNLVFDPHRIEGGELPESLRGYDRVAEEVESVRIDLIRVSGF